MGAKAVAAVDIGGSGLRLQVADSGGPGRVHAAPGVRVGSDGIDVSALVRDAKALLCSARPEAREGIDSVCWSQRGLLQLSSPRDVLDTVAGGLGAARTVVVSDAVAALVGALGGVIPGGVVAAGTGAVAFGCDFGPAESGVWRRIDGWGHILGDRGSAAWVGLRGVQMAVRHLDGVSGGSADLYAAARLHFGPEAGWVREVMTRGDAPELLAGFAPFVNAAAETNDPGAQRICRDAGEFLAESLHRAVSDISDAPVSATGGLFTATAIRDSFEAEAARRGLRLVAPVGSPLDGAMHLARALGDRGGVPEHPAYVYLRT